MADTALDQLQTAIKRQWSRAPSQKAKPYVNTFSARVRSGKLVEEPVTRTPPHLEPIVPY